MPTRMRKRDKREKSKGDRSGARSNSGAQIRTPINLMGFQDRFGLCACMCDVGILDLGWRVVLEG